jgi:hypothetical protein
LFVFGGKKGEVLLVHPEQDLQKSSITNPICTKNKWRPAKHLQTTQTNRGSTFFFQRDKTGGPPSKVDKKAGGNDFDSTCDKNTCK